MLGVQELNQWGERRRKMETLMKKINSWAEDEDPQVEEVMKKLYGPFFKLSFLFPSWKRENMPFTIISFLTYIVTVGVHNYLLALSIILLRDDFELASLAFHYWLILSFTMIIIPLVNTNRQKIARAHRIVATDVGKYHPESIYNDEKPLQWEKDKKKQLIQFLCLPGFIVIVAAGCLFVPYVQRLRSESPGQEAHYTARGVNMHLPIAARYPFPTHKSIGHFAAVGGQLVTGFFLASVLIGGELMCFRMSQNIIIEFKVLQYGVHTTLARARKLYEQLRPEDNQEMDKTNYEYQRCIGVCFKDCVRHHYAIKELITGYEILIKWPGALAYGIGTGVIGLSLVNILVAKEKGNVENIILFSLLSLAEVLNMYMLSSFGENITTESQILRDQLYFIEWHTLDVQNRRLLLNFQVGTINPVIIKAGGLVDMCMDTFSSIINTSYSFFNLMNAQ